MGWKVFFSFIFFLLVVFLLVFYWFVPFREIDFGISMGSSNFSLGTSDTTGMQFYNNMRYPDSKISYNIDNCSLKKMNDMETAFGMISNRTVLEFYPVNSKEEISVTCDSRNKIEEGLFIAGEGGPTNITKSGEFSVILGGKILLIRESDCSRPNVALHELLHTLGFNHSTNSQNIMYYLSNCNQVIGEDQLELLNTLYEAPSYPDLVFQHVSSFVHGRYLDANLSIRNNGFKASEAMKIQIYADESLIREIDVETLSIGHGMTYSLKNIWISKVNFKKLIFRIDYSLPELKKENNKIILEIKNKKE